jgi:glycine/sarcosine N-methyltransferase
MKLLIFERRSLKFENYEKSPSRFFLSHFKLHHSNFIFVLVCWRVMMYSGLAKHYDEIFPLDEAASLFVKKESAKAPSREVALDIGCGTGNMTFELEKSFKAVTGIDLDAGMVARAKEKAAQQGKRSSFLVLDMAAVALNFPANSFDLVTCLGNTLVHLEDLRQVGAFLGQVRTILKPGGLFLLQILNYDHIIDHAITTLPPLETPLLSFQRKYIFTPGETRVVFETVLNVKGDDDSATDSVKLLLLHRNSLEKGFARSWFPRSEFFWWV